MTAENPSLEEKYRDKYGADDKEIVILNSVSELLNQHPEGLPITDIFSTCRSDELGIGNREIRNMIYTMVHRGQDLEITPKRIIRSTHPSTNE